MNKIRNIMIVLVFTALSVWATFLFRSIKADYEFIPQLPENSVDQQAEEYYRGYFPEEQVLILAIDAGEQSAARAAEVFTLLSDLPGTYILGPDRLIDHPQEGQQQPDIRSDSGSSSRIVRTEELLSKDPFTASLFTSPTSTARLFYLYKTQAEKDVALLARIQERLPTGMSGTIRFWGLPYYRAIQEIRAQRDTRYLIPTAALVCLLMQLLITRRLSSALSLWAVSIIPALWATALYPLSVTDFKIESILVPVQIIALSTSYAIQYYRYATLHAALPIETKLKGIRPIILLSGTTTILGFLSLLAIPIPAIRSMAGFIVLGIAFAMATALILLPILLEKTAERGKLPLLFNPQPGVFANKPALPLIMVLILVVVATGLPRVASGAVVSNFFRPWDEYSQTSEFMNEHFGGLDEFELIIDGGEEFFFINPEHFKELTVLATGIRQLSWVSIVLDPPRFIDWSFRRINGQDRPPSTLEEIGETVELATGNLQGLSIRSMLADDSRFARILIRGSLPDPLAFKAAIQNIRHQAEQVFPGKKYHLTGALLRHQAFEGYLIRGLLQGLAWFLPTLFFFLLLYFRLPIPALLAMIPPTTALLVYFGLAGWLGIRVNSVVTVGAAVVMGVGVDDVLHLLLTVQAAMKAGFSKRKSCTIALTTSGKSIIQTTVVIIAGLAVLGFSSFTSVAQVGFLASAGLATATFATLILVPYLTASKT